MVYALEVLNKNCNLVLLLDLRNQQHMMNNNGEDFYSLRSYAGKFGQLNTLLKLSKSQISIQDYIQVKKVIHDENLQNFGANDEENVRPFLNMANI